MLDQAYRKESSTAFPILISASLSAFSLLIHMVEDLGASKLWLMLAVLVEGLQAHLIINIFNVLFQSIPTNLLLRLNFGVASLLLCVQN